MFTIYLFPNPDRPDYASFDPEAYREAEFETYEEAFAFAQKTRSEGLWDCEFPTSPA